MLPALRTFDPRDVDRTFAAFDRLFRDLDGRSRPAGAALPLNVYEDDERYVLVAPVPGVKAEDLELDAEADHLVIGLSRQVRAPEGFEVVRRERLATKTRRRVRFAAAIDAANITAELKHGVLTVTVPKAAEARRRRIPVDIS